MFSQAAEDTKNRVFSAGGRDMEQTLWNLFRETGDPMGYLLCKAEERARENEATRVKPASGTQAPPPAGPPPASN